VQPYPHTEIYLINHPDEQNKKRQMSKSVDMCKIMNDAAGGKRERDNERVGAYHDVHNFRSVYIGHLLQPADIAQVPLVAWFLLQSREMRIESFVLRSQPGEIICETWVHHVLIASAGSKTVCGLHDNVKGG